MRQNVLHRFSIMILVALGSASCGFTPVYAPGSTTAAALSDIVVAPPANDRANYLFVRNLEERIGQNLNGGKVLKHDIWIYEEGGGSESSVSRVQVIGKVTYQVSSVEDGRSLFGGFVENFVAFSTDDNILSSARTNATERLITILVNQLVTQLMVQLSSFTEE